ncbi:1,25-dihydroxyvitamin D(3) 24-hydroxylase, mitochondrial-like [Mytilus californianus]|uniref:1,25-dihydroxyvitamin D(3) 24-hydroxylase, mitochondrial-like n=1 Tax=Mytilus californianus TaxID=6549 RepID=UPI0022487315|nr:1,25-dihydroxyvitamin D(3) 24-hydroxylase, mitochondrial-like [Mytilus californianus]
MHLVRLCRPYPGLINKEVKVINTWSSHTASTSTVVRNDPSLPSEIKPFSAVPGPKGLYSVPYIGAALHFKPFTKYSANEINDLLTDLRKKYGDIFKMKFGKDYMVYINHPDDAKTILQAHYELHKRISFDLSETLAEREKVNKGLILLNGKEWADLRKPTQEKMLRPAVVASYVPLIEKVTNDFVDNLKKKKQVDDLLWELNNYTTESVGMLCFNKRLGCLDEGTDSPAEVAVAMRNIFDMLQKSFFMPVKMYLYFKTPFYKRFEQEGRKFMEVVSTETASQNAFLAKLKNEGKLEEYLEKEPNFMYSLLADGRLSEEQISSIVSDLFGAGIDSTANTLVFLLAQLALNPDKQAKLYDEIQQVVGDSQRLTKEHLARMSYLKACLKESQRKIFPISFGVLRILESDLVVGGYQMPKNTMIAINNRSMAMDDRFYNRPTEFLPERWLRETTGEIAKSKEFPFAHKPFGFGPRACIGQRFAENEIFIAATKIVKNFQVSMPPDVKDIKTTLKIFTTPSEKIKMNFMERQ